MKFRRHFVTLAEGDMHVREAGEDNGQPPILLLHPSPASSRALLPLATELAASRRVIAPDTLGNGDSCPPTPSAPNLAYYADSCLRLADALALTEFDVYGSHTGSHIGIELALAAGDRVRSLVLHGIALLDDAERSAFLAHYAPPQQIDQIGSQFHWAWHFIRDQMIFYPYFRKQAGNIRAGGNLDAIYLHELTLDVLKNIHHYHKTYHAVFEHDVLSRLGGLQGADGTARPPG